MLPTTSSTLTVSTSATETGSSSAKLTLSYTTVNTYLSSSWLYIKLPKANSVYSSNSGQAISFISDSDKANAEVSIGGVTHTVDSTSAYLAIGSGYTEDTWAFTFSTSNTFTSTGQVINVSIDITNPEMIGDLTSGWSFEIKTESGNYPPCTSCSYPDEYASYEKALSVSGGVDVTTIL